MIDLTICVTFCEQDKYIKPLINTLEALICRSRYRCEILIGVDHPTRETEEILHDVAHLSKNIKIFKVNSNKNLIPLSRASVNRIQLLKNATGPYVMLLDGDDEYIDVVDDGIEFLNEHPDFVAVAYNFIEFYEKKSVYKKVQDPYPKKSVVTYFAHCAGRRYFSSNCLVLEKCCARCYLGRFAIL